MENVKILIANTSMDADKIKVISVFQCFSCLVPRRYVLFYCLRGLCVDQFDRFFRFSPSRAVPRVLNDVNKPKRLGTRQVF